MSFNRPATSANFAMSSEINSQWNNQSYWNGSAANVNYQTPQWQQQGTWLPNHSNMGMMQNQISHSATIQHPVQRPFPTQMNSACNMNQWQPQMQPQWQAQVQQPATQSPLMNQFLKPHNPSASFRSHQARISLVPSATGGFKAVVKRKRKRTMFTTEQVEALESVFSKKQYVTREDREMLVDQLQINDTSIKVWFQNRRLKGKRVAAEMAEEDFEETFPKEESFYSDTNSSSSEQSLDSIKTTVRLDQLEAKIDQRANGSGYVLLDDNMLAEIAAVIDTVLSSDVDIDALSSSPISNETEGLSESDGSTCAGSVYEPISPAASENNDEEVTRWQPEEPGQSLQRLFDLHFC